MTVRRASRDLEAAPEYFNVYNREDSDGCVRGSILPVGQKQSLASKSVALVTLLVFIAWPYFMFALCIASVLGASGLLGMAGT